MCTPITFHGITPEIFACLKAKLEAAGVIVPDGNMGTINGSHFTGTFSYLTTLAMLDITVMSKPFLVSCGYITGKIHDEIVAAGGE